MTGPEHYREAERHLSWSSEVEIDQALDLPGAADWHQKQAQVHATLALAAATAMNDGDSGLGFKDHMAWRRVASVNPPADGEMQA